MGWAQRGVHYIDLLDVLTGKALKARYQSTFLGYLWSLLNPLAYAVVFHVAFKVVLRIAVPNYTLFLLTGLFPWQWISNSLNAAPDVFLSNAVLIKKIRFPRNLIVMSQVLQDSFHFALSLPVILLASFYYGVAPTLAWIWAVPMLFVAQFGLVYGLSLVIASCNVFFRDLERLVMLGLFLIFYLTPVVYPPQMLPAHYQWLLKVNPFGALIEGWRTLFLEGHLPITLLAAAAVAAAGAIVLGHLVYERLQWKFAEAL